MKEKMKERRDMKNAQISVRLDENLKNEFDIFCKESNITVKYAVETFIVKTIEGKKIPFKVNRFLEIFFEFPLKPQSLSCFFRFLIRNPNFQYYFS